jgi:hypothetical protein
MKIEAVVPMLTVPDVPAEVTFYTEIPGFTPMQQTEDWACVNKDDCEVMFAASNAHLPFDCRNLPAPSIFSERTSMRPGGR